jgi:hypothetical protein
LGEFSQGPLQVTIQPGDIMPNEVPKTRTQALVLLAESVGSALLAYGHHLRGIDPLEEAAGDETSNVVPIISPDLPEPEAETDEEPRKERRARLKLSHEQWRSLFADLPTHFSIPYAMKRYGYSDGQIRNGLERIKDEIEMVSPARMRGGDKAGREPAIYRFKRNPAYAEPQPWVAPDPDAEPEPDKGPKKQRKPRRPAVTFDRKEWRNLFVTMPQPFTIRDVCERHDMAEGQVRRGLEKVGDEVVKIKEATMPAGGTENKGREGAVYQFNSQAGAPAPEPEPEPQAEESAPPTGAPIAPPPVPADPNLHPNRLDGHAKPSVSDSELNKLIDAAWAAGWDVTMTENSHLRFLSPNREIKPIFGPTTPSDHRAVKNLRSELGRAGLTLPEKERRGLAGLLR